MRIQTVMGARRSMVVDSFECEVLSFRDMRDWV